MWPSPSYFKPLKCVNLLLGEKVKVCENHSTCPAQSYVLRWSLIALLALASLYSCVITTAYVRLRVTISVRLTAYNMRSHFTLKRSRLILFSSGMSVT